MATETQSRAAALIQIANGRSKMHLGVSLRSAPGALETLNLRYTKVSTPGLAQLKGLADLRRLWTSESQLLEAAPTKQWQVWLASAYGDDIYVYELGSFKLLKRLTVGPNPHGISATADDRTVHVALEHFDDPVGELAWINTRTFNITARLDVGPQPQEIECTPDGKRDLRSLRRRQMARRR